MTIAHQRTNIPNRMFLPCFETFPEFTTCCNDVVIHRKEEFGLTLWRQRISEIHGVLRSLNEIHRPLPFFQLPKSGILGSLLIVPNDHNFFDFRAIHGCVATQVLVDELVVLPGIICGRDDAEPTDN